MLKRSIIVLCLLVAACATPEQQEAQRQAQMQQDADSCASYGFRPNSDAFRNCMLQIDLARQQRYNNYNYDPYPRFSYGFYQFRH